jgi:endonuclease/exonuclease/phosphatase family metal-dependent hydrolase
MFHFIKSFLTKYKKLLRVVFYIFLALLLVCVLLYNFANYGKLEWQVSEFKNDFYEKDLSLKVMSFNIAHGRGLAFNQVLVHSDVMKANLDGIAAFIKKHQPDIVGFQEVDADADWSGNFNHAAYIAEKAGYPYVKTGINNVNNGFFTINYGNAIISKHRITKFDNYRFGKAKLGEKGFLVARIDFKGLQINVAVTHLDYKFKSNRARQLKEMENILKPIEGPMIVMGDFNCSLGGKDDTLNQFQESLKLNAWAEEAGTYPAENPRKCIDYIFTRAGLRIKKYGPKKTILSDHLPLMSEIQISKSK